MDVNDAKFFTVDAMTNTPTPAQALGDALKMIGQPSDVRSDYEWQNCARECMQFLVQHGQHFAGLEAWRFELCERLGLSCAAGATWSVDDVYQLVASEERKLLDRAEAAEARVRELEAEASILRNAANREELNLLTRVREAEGLFLEIIESFKRSAMLAGIDPVPDPDPKSIGGRVAAFLAARG